MHTHCNSALVIAHEIAHEIFSNAIQAVYLANAKMDFWSIFRAPRDRATNVPFVVYTEPDIFLRNGGITFTSVLEDDNVLEDDKIVDKKINMENIRSIKTNEYLIQDDSEGRAEFEWTLHDGQQYWLSICWTPKMFQVYCGYPIRSGLVCYGDNEEHNLEEQLVSVCEGIRNYKAKPSRSQVAAWQWLRTTVLNELVLCAREDRDHTIASMIVKTYL